MLQIINKTKIIILLALLPMQLFINLTHAAEYLGPSAIVADSKGSTIYIAEKDAEKIDVWDVATKKIQKSISLDYKIMGLAMAADDSRLYVTSVVPEGQVFVVNAKTHEVLSQIAVGHTPCDLLPSPDGRTLYVCNRFSNNISIIDLAAGKETNRITVRREPVAAALTPDGKILLVINHMPVGASDRDYVAAEISFISTSSLKVIASIPLYNGSTALQDIALSHDGKFAYIPHILARYQLPTTQLERGWMNTNALTVVDVSQQKLLNTVLLDDVDHGAANPWAVAVSADDDYLCVTTAGTHELHIVDRKQLHGKLELATAGKRVTEVTSSVSDVPNDLTFLLGIKRRISLAGKGPRAITLVGSKAYIVEYFSDSLSVVDINPGISSEIQSYKLGTRIDRDPIRQGEMFFHDASLCFQQWQSCSSCHSGEGRIDALNWDLLNDGLGNPKNTKSLLLSNKTPPVMAMGVRPNSQIGVRAGIRHIQMAIRPESDAQAIDAYLESIEAIPSPYLVKGELSKEAQHGRMIFQKAGCANCHTPGLYTNMKSYNVDTGKGIDAGKPFDVPTLIELWRTAPYLSDGRAATIQDVFTLYNPDDRHGKTSTLKQQELEDLSAFLLSL
ncbi:MAG: cell surface protein [Phycisphaerae bacterium]|nr:cell surface protein [Phycisphaerae bacterium]